MKIKNILTKTGDFFKGIPSAFKRIYSRPKPALIFTSAALAVTLCAVLGIGALAGWFAPRETAFGLAITNPSDAVSDGEYITARSTRKKTKIEFYALSVPDGIAVDKDSGRVSIGPNVLRGASFMVYAGADGVRTLPRIFRAGSAARVDEINIVNISGYLIDGDYVKARCTPRNIVRYALSSPVAGVSVDEFTGRVAISPSVADDTEFAVYASALNVKTPARTFKALTTNFVKAKNSNVYAAQKGGGADLGVYVDYGIHTDARFVSLGYGAETVPSEFYTYDSATDFLTLKSEFINTLDVGEEVLSINTTLNAVQIVIKLADKIIRTPQQLQDINKDINSLSGYYVLGNDIDLADYCAKGRGWNQIGIYYELPNPPYTPDYTRAFTGVFDGNGFAVRNIRLFKKSDYDSNNAGLFGFISSTGMVSNLALIGGTVTAKGYAGGFVGMNDGVIINCYSTAAVNCDGAAVGGFAGINQNGGAIRNCYVSASVAGGSAATLGALVGDNRSLVVDCRADSTAAGVSKLCGLNPKFPAGTERGVSFLTGTQMTDPDNFAGFSPAAWILTDGVKPSLKADTVNYFYDQLEITNTRAEYRFTPGTANSFAVTAAARPVQSSIITKTLFYELEGGDGVTIDADGNVAVSAGASYPQTVTVTVSAAGGVFARAVFGIYSPTDSITLAEQSATVRAGGSVSVDYAVAPATASRTVKLELEYGVFGVSIDGGKVVVSPDVVDGVKFKVRAAQDGVNSAYAEYTVKGFKEFVGNTAVIEKGSAASAAFNLPGVNVKSVVSGGASVAYGISDSSVVIAADAVSKMPTGDNVLLISGGADTYRAVIKICDKIITTTEEFTAINSPADSFAALRKYYVLGADLDFNGAAVDSIGSYYEINGVPDSSQYFFGTFDGNGHTISNFVNTSVSDDRYKHCKGLFGYVYGGTIKNLAVTGAAYNTTGKTAGGIVGILDGGTVSDCYADVKIGADSYDAALSQGVKIQNSGAVAGIVENGGIVKNCVTVSGINAGTADQTSSLVNAVAGMNNGSVVGCIADKARALNGAAADCYISNNYERESGCKILDAADIAEGAFLMLDSRLWSLNGDNYPELIAR